MSKRWAMRLEEILLLEKYGRMVPPDRVIIEIGTLWGFSAKWLALISGCRVIAIDIDHREDYLGERVTMISAKSSDYVYNRSEEVGLVLIDGDHSEECFLGDWARYSPLVASGGYVLIHDYAKPSYPWITNLVESQNVVEIASKLAVVRVT